MRLLELHDDVVRRALLSEDPAADRQHPARDDVSVVVEHLYVLTDSQRLCEWPSLCLEARAGLAVLADAGAVGGNRWAGSVGDAVPSSLGCSDRSTPWVGGVGLY